MKPLRIGMIGYGFMGRAHANAYRKVSQFFDLEYHPGSTNRVVDVGVPALAGFWIAVGRGEVRHVRAGAHDGAPSPRAVVHLEPADDEVGQRKAEIRVGVALDALVLEIERALLVAAGGVHDIEDALPGLHRRRIDSVAAAPGDVRNGKCLLSNAIRVFDST